MCGWCYKRRVLPSCNPQSHDQYFKDGTVGDEAKQETHVSQLATFHSLVQVVRLAGVEENRLLAHVRMSLELMQPLACAALRRT